MAELAVFALWLASSIQVVGAIEVLPGQRDQFASAACRLQVKLPVRMEGEKVRWRLMANERTLSVGQSLLQLVSEQENGRAIYTVEFNTPELNEGVSIDAQLILEVEQSKTLASTSLVIRHGDSFAGLVTGHLRIAILDPDGSMAADLKKTSIVARYSTKLSDVQEEECIIIGEGLRWDTRVSKAVEAWIRLGKQVVVLRSEVGSDVSIDSTFSLNKLEFGQLNDSRWAAPTIDPEYWPTLGKRVAGWSVSLSPETLTLTPCIAEHQLDDRRPQLWQITEFRTTHGGNCIFIGVPIMKNWNQSPVPRELLKTIIQVIDQQHKSKPNSSSK